MLKIESKPIRAYFDEVLLVLQKDLSADRHRVIGTAGQVVELAEVYLGDGLLAPLAPSRPPMNFESRSVSGGIIVRESAPNNLSN